MQHWKILMYGVVSFSAIQGGMTLLKVTAFLTNAQRKLYKKIILMIIVVNIDK